MEAPWLGILYSMHSRPLYLFLTLVLSLGIDVQAAPSRDVNDPPENEGSSETEVQATPDLIDRQNLVITPTVMTKKEEKEISYLYPYNQSISPRIILIIDSEEIKGDLNIPYGLGITYLAPRRKQPQIEAGAEMFSTSDGHIHAGLRWVYFSDNYFRPYYKVGLAHAWKAKEKLASFSNWKNYLVKVGAGFEDVIKPPMSARLEIEAAIGTEDMFLLLSLGYSWAW